MAEKSHAVQKREGKMLSEEIFLATNMLIIPSFSLSLQNNYHVYEKTNHYIHCFIVLPHNGGRGCYGACGTGERIGPLLTTHWFQDYPYNAKCPVINGERPLP